MLQEPRTIVNALAINEDNVMVTGGDNGALWCDASVASVLGPFNPFKSTMTSGLCPSMTCFWHRGPLKLLHDTEEEQTLSLGAVEL